jgi:hypothetical protein
MKEEEDTWLGGLRLPGVREKAVIDVRLNMNMKKSKFDSANSVADISIEKNEWIDRGLFTFRMSPLDARPGWTRIEHTREIALSPGLRHYEAATLRYWTKSEMACLALA